MGISTEIYDIVPVSEADESNDSKQTDSLTTTTPPEYGPSEPMKSEVAESDCRNKQH